MTYSPARRGVTEAVFPVSFFEDIFDEDIFDVDILEDDILGAWAESVAASARAGRMESILRIFTSYFMR
jgi:hypothetical protein